LVPNEGHTLEKLGISKTSIAHLENQPHIDALRWRWDKMGPTSR